MAHTQSRRKYRLGGSRWLLKLRRGVCESLPLPTHPYNRPLTPLRVTRIPTTSRISPPSVLRYPHHWTLPPPTRSSNVTEDETVRSWLNRVPSRNGVGVTFASGGRGGLDGRGSDGREVDAEDRRAETARRFVTVTRALTSSGECTREEALLYVRFAPLFRRSFFLIRRVFSSRVFVSRCDSLTFGRSFVRELIRYSSKEEPEILFELLRC